MLADAKLGVLVASLLSGAIERVHALPAGERHVVIVGGMAALFLCGDAARRPEWRATTAALARSGGTLTRVLVPGEQEGPAGGWLAQRGPVPLGYLGDPEKTARTFPLIGGERFSVPGDRAELL